MTFPWLSTPVLRGITYALLAYCALRGALFLADGLGARGSIDAGGAFLLALLGFTALLGFMGMRKVKDERDAIGRRRLLLNIATMMAGGVALMAFLGRTSDILTLALPMLVLSFALHLVDRRYNATRKGIT